MLESDAETEILRVRQSDEASDALRRFDRALRTSFGLLETFPDALPSVDEFGLDSAARVASRHNQSFAVRGAGRIAGSAGAVVLRHPRRPSKLPSVTRAEPSADLEFHSRRGEPGSPMRTVTEGLVRRMSTTAQADSRFLDQFFSAISMANCV